jgi:hypothetical protein
MGTIDLTSGDPQTDAERAAWLLENGYQVVKSDSHESDDILEGVSGEAQDDEGENQPRHPATGQFLPKTQKGSQMTQLSSENEAGVIQRLEKQVANPNLDPVARADAAQELTLRRLSSHLRARRLGAAVGAALAKGAAQDALHGTDAPEVVGRVTDFGRSAAAGSVTQGVRTPASDSSLSLGGQSTAAIALESTVNTNATNPVTTDGAGIVNPQAMAKDIERLEGAIEKALDRGDDREAQRLGEQLTFQRLKLHYTAKAGQLGGARTGNLTADEIAPTARVAASDVGAVGQSVLPEYLAKQQRKAAKKAKKRRDEQLKKAVRQAIDRVTA